MEDTTYGTQAKQDQIDLVVEVEGCANWKDLLADEMQLEGFWAKHVGADKVSKYDFFATYARLNGMTVESARLAHILDMGYVLEAVELEFHADDRGKWGKCRWLKDHESYSDPDNFMRENADVEVQMKSCRL